MCIQTPARSVLEDLERRLFLSATDLYPNQFREQGDAPVARFEAYGTVVGDKIVVMGGFDATFTPIPNIDVFDSASRTWSTIQTTIPIAETHAGHAVDGSSIYFAGGYFGPLGSARAQPISNAVWRYDTSTDNWEQLADLPAGRGGGALVRVGRELHYFGGCLKDRVTNSGAHWMLQLGRTSGGADDGARWTRRPAMPSPRDHFSAVAVDDMIYALGGEYGHDVHHAQSRLTHSFDTATGLWKRLADMPVAKSHFESATFAFGDKIIAAGGQVEDYRSTRDVSQYDITTNDWQAVKSLPAPRQGSVTQRIGDTLYIALGGLATDQPVDDVWAGQFRAAV